MTSTVAGCSRKRSGIFSSPSRTSSRLISLATTMTGTVGNSACAWRKSRESTVASPMPASKILSAGGVGRMFFSSAAARLATADFSLQVLTNARYFCRLS